MEAAQFLKHHMPRIRQVIEIFRHETSGTDIYSQVGVSGLSTATIVERVGLADAVGFRMLQSSLPLGSAQLYWMDDVLSECVRYIFGFTVLAICRAAH